MGVGGNFWELLKPYARHEGVDFLRDKKVAVDLSFWIVQHGTAVSRCYNPGALKPHLRITLFRTVNLFAKMGAYPVFVVDGEPSHLKTRARMERFFRATGLDMSTSPAFTKAEVEGASVKRNPVFSRCVDECVELLELLGLPVLRARSEAEALCAQLNVEGLVDACITADSDAILYGAKCVVKALQSNSKEPFECYNMSDIEAGLGLKRKQLIAISLLVGNDHDLNGVTGIGIDSAVRFVQLFNEDDILDRLSQVGKGCLFTGFPLPTSDEDSLKRSSSHCSNCGHPGSKKIHAITGCEECYTRYNENCIKKPKGFRCRCSTCDEMCRMKESKKHRSWQMRVCKRISDEPDFPNNEIINMYLSNNNGSYDGMDGPSLLWGKPAVDDLVDFLAYHLHWEPAHTRRRVLPMLSTIFLREMASDPDERLLVGQYTFHSIHRTKIRYSHPYYVVKWKKAPSAMVLCTENISEEQSEFEEKVTNEVDTTHTDNLDITDFPEVLIDEGCCFLLTDENMGLVEAAFPVETDRFLKAKELKESSKRKKPAGVKSPEIMKSSGLQLNITQFYRTTKTVTPANPDNKPSRSSGQGWHEKKGNIEEDAPDPSLFKSARRCLQFD